MNFIDAHRHVHGVEPICAVLQIAPSGYRRHAARRRDPEQRCARAKRDAVLVPEIERVWRAKLQVHWADKVWHQLGREGTAIARCTVERLDASAGVAWRAQVLAHFWGQATEYEVQVSHGLHRTQILQLHRHGRPDGHHFQETVFDPCRIRQMLFGGFACCIYEQQKFDLDTERRFAIILERDALKWFKPAKGQFRIYYKLGSEQREYIPDFVVATDATILMVKTRPRRHRHPGGADQGRCRRTLVRASFSLCRRGRQQALALPAGPA